MSLSSTTADCVMRDAVARRELLLVAAGVEADVATSPSRPGGEDRGDRVLGEL